MAENEEDYLNDEKVRILAFLFEVVSRGTYQYEGRTEEFLCQKFNLPHVDFADLNYRRSSDYGFMTNEQRKSDIEKEAGEKRKEFADMDVKTMNLALAYVASRSSEEILKSLPEEELREGLLEFHSMILEKKFKDLSHNFPVVDDEPKWLQKAIKINDNVIFDQAYLEKAQSHIDDDFKYSYKDLFDKTYAYINKTRIKNPSSTIMPEEVKIRKHLQEVLDIKSVQNSEDWEQKTIKGRAWDGFDSFLRYVNKKDGSERIFRHGRLSHIIQKDGTVQDYFTSKDQKSIKIKLSNGTLQEYDEEAHLKKEITSNGTRREWCNEKLETEVIPNGPTHHYYLSGAPMYEEIPGEVIRQWYAPEGSEDKGSLMKESYENGTIREWYKDGKPRMEYIPNSCKRTWDEQGNCTEILQDGTETKWFEENNEGIVCTGKWGKRARTWFDDGSCRDIYDGDAVVFEPGVFPIPEKPSYVPGKDQANYKDSENKEKVSENEIKSENLTPNQQPEKQQFSDQQELRTSENIITEPQKEEIIQENQTSKNESDIVTVSEPDVKVEEQNVKVSESDTKLNEPQVEQNNNVADVSKEADNKIVDTPEKVISEPEKQVSEPEKAVSEPLKSDEKVQETQVKTKDEDTKAYKDFGEILKDKTLTEDEKMWYLNGLIEEEKQQLAERKAELGIKDKQQDTKDLEQMSKVQKRDALQNLRGVGEKSHNVKLVSSGTVKTDQNITSQTAQKISALRNLRHSR